MAGYTRGYRSYRYETAGCSQGMIYRTVRRRGLLIIMTRDTMNRAARADYILNRGAYCGHRINVTSRVMTSGTGVQMDSLDISH